MKTETNMVPKIASKPSRDEKANTFFPVVLRRKHTRDTLTFSF